MHAYVPGVHTYTCIQAHADYKQMRVAVLKKSIARSLKFGSFSGRGADVP